MYVVVDQVLCFDPVTLSGSVGMSLTILTFQFIKNEMKIWKAVVIACDDGTSDIQF